MCFSRYFAKNSKDTFTSQETQLQCGSNYTYIYIYLLAKVGPSTCSGQYFLTKIYKYVGTYLFILQFIQFKKSWPAHENSNG